MVSKKQLLVSEQIKNAFIELLCDESFMDITVTQLVEKAKVARASFYRNFETTEDVANNIIDDLLAQLSNVFEPLMDTNDEVLWRESLYHYIYLLHDSERRYLAIRPDNIALLLTKLIYRFRKLTIYEEPKDIVEKYDFISRFSLVNGVVIKWHENDMDDSIDDLIDYLVANLRVLNQVGLIINDI